jgi:hypothetical protein
MPGTYEVTQVGKREDLADIIAVVDAKKTPFTTMLKKDKEPINTVFSWQVDSYDEPKTTGIREGKDVDEYEDAAQHRQVLQGRTQKHRRVFKVTTEAERVSKVAGINYADPQGVRGGTEFARAKAKKTVEFKRDIERTFLSDNDSMEEGITPRLTRGLGAWLDSTLQKDSPVPKDYQTPKTSIFKGPITAFNESVLRSLLESRWDRTSGKDELVAFMGPVVKNAISDFANFDATKPGHIHVHAYMGGKINHLDTTIDIYKGDYGSFEIHLSHFLPDKGRCYILDMGMLKGRNHTLPYYKDLPDMAGGPRGYIEGIGALLMLNPLGHNLIQITVPAPAADTSISTPNAGGQS